MGKRSVLSVLAGFLILGTFGIPQAVADPEPRVLDLLQNNSQDATVGLYLKEVNGNVLADFNESFVFEPASTIKVTHHLNAMLKVQNDANFDLTTSVNYFQDSTDNVNPIMDDPNTPGDERASGCPVDTNQSSDTAENGLTAMMVPSDNRWTQAFRVLLGEANINDMIQNDLGMTDTQLNHRIGCANDAINNPNQLTLVDAGKLYEEVANGFLNQNTRDDFYEIMIQDNSRFETIIDDEVIGLDLSPDGLDEFKAERYSALKAGSYTLGGKEYRSVAGWAEIPFRNSSCELITQEYVFGVFIHDATSLGPTDDIRTFGVDLFREEIRKGLESFVDCEVDLDVEKSGPSDPVVAGTEITYTVTVENNGPSEAENVVVVDTLHPDLIYISDTGGCVQGPPDTLTCNLGNFADGDSDSFDVTAKIPADYVYNGGTIVGNEGDVSSDQIDINLDNNDAAVVNNVIAETDVEILSFTATETPEEVLIGDSFDVTVTKTITNNGISSPVDVSALVKASAAGVDIVPPQAIPVVVGLEINEEDDIIEDFTITCEEPGIHEVTISNEIMPNDATDTDTSNNEAEVVMQVECVIPVEINIHPGSYPNPINLKSKSGVVPIAILTTTEGEYGLPLAIDATMIDPTSVHFGPSGLLFGVDPPGGATEFHNKGHPQDSFEPDDATKDGDTDMVLHFKVKETGLEESDSEACVKGQIDIGGMLSTFFGCDDFISKP